MNRIRVFVATLVAISSFLSLTAQNAKMSEWKHLFIGIEQATGSIDGADYSQAYALRVDLRAPGISFYTTPHQGSLNTIATTTSDFLKKFGLQVAVNANFFAPCCNAAAEEKTVLGLAVSDGNTVAVPSSIPGQNAALVITRGNQASIGDPALLWRETARATGATLCITPAGRGPSCWVLRDASPRTP